MHPVVDEEGCIACGTCAAVCPAEPTVFEVAEVSKVMRPEACIECGACEENCPTGSIKLTN